MSNAFLSDIVGRSVSLTFRKSSSVGRLVLRLLCHCPSIRLLITSILRSRLAVYSIDLWPILLRYGLPVRHRLPGKPPEPGRGPRKLYSQQARPSYRPRRHRGQQLVEGQSRKRDGIKQVGTPNLTPKDTPGLIKPGKWAISRLSTHRDNEYLLRSRDRV